jgi:Mg2+ and Co2+ transporter CorA
MGGPEDFNASKDWTSPKLPQETPGNRGMLDELVYHWATKPQTMFDPRQPTLRGLSYLPLNIVAAEWINFISLMSFCLKQYEASSLSSDLQLELDKLSANLRTLQTWRRRVLASMDKIKHTIRYLKLHQPTNACSGDWAALLEDYEFISTSIQENGNRLEAMTPVSTSFIQLVESRRALLESTNITRLTVLAVVFVPLSYVASLFSMNEKFGPGGQYFWSYFAIAVPITLFVLVVARVPKHDWFSFRRQGLRLRFWGRKSRIL